MDRGKCPWQFWRGLCMERKLRDCENHKQNPRAGMGRGASSQYWHSHPSEGCVFWVCFFSFYLTSKYGPNFSSCSMLEGLRAVGYRDAAQSYESHDSTVLLLYPQVWKPMRRATGPLLINTHQLLVISIPVVFPGQQMTECFSLRTSTFKIFFLCATENNTSFFFP